MGLYHALLGYCVARWLPAGGLTRWLLALPAAWLLIEWWRGWFLSGFSWLSLGYSQTDTWLAGFAPIVGVYGISALLLVCAGALATLACAHGLRARLVALTVLLVPWLAGFALHGRSWTHPCRAAGDGGDRAGRHPAGREVARASNRETTLALYQTLTEKVLGTSSSCGRNRPRRRSPTTWRATSATCTAKPAARARRWCSGCCARRTPEHPDEDALLQLGAGAVDDQVSWYDKRHLVPFGEIFPVPGFVRSWMRLHEPAVLGLHPRRGRAAAAAGRAACAWAPPSATRMPTAAPCCRCCRRRTRW